MSLSSGGTVEGWRPSSYDEDNVEFPQAVYESPTSPSTFSLTEPAVRTTYSYSHSNLAQPSSYSISPPEYFPSYDLEQTSTAGLSSSDRRAIRNKMRDPSWVPRPRNAFIIFRCDYAREHARDVVVTSPSNSIPSDKTLSKRAAEAWKKLPAAQKEEYKGRAEREKDEHARQNPYYRFKPMRRSASSSRGGSRQRSERGEKVATLVSRGRRGSQNEGASRRWEGGMSGSAEHVTHQPRGRSPTFMGRRRSSSVPMPLIFGGEQEASQPIPVPPSCASSPGPWYEQMEGSSNGGTPQETPPEEVSALLSEDIGEYGAGSQLEPLSDNTLFSGYTFPSSNTSYFPTGAQPFETSSDLYTSSSFPGAASQSSLLTVRPHPGASQASLLTIRPMPGASQTSLLTIRQRPRPRPFVPAPRLPTSPRPFLPAGVNPPPRSQPFVPSAFRPHPPAHPPGNPGSRPGPIQLPGPSAVRQFSTVPQVPVLVEPHLSPLMTMGSTFNEWSFESTSQYDRQGSRDDGSSSASSEGSGSNTPYSSDSDAEGYTNAHTHAHQHMPSEGIPIPRPRYSPPLHPPPQFVDTSPSTSMTSSSSIPYHHQSWDTDAFGFQIHGQPRPPPSISIQDTDPSSSIFWDTEAFGDQGQMQMSDDNAVADGPDPTTLSPSYDLRANLGVDDFF